MAEPQKKTFGDKLAAFGQVLSLAGAGLQDPMAPIKFVQEQEQLKIKAAAAEQDDLLQKALIASVLGGNISQFGGQGVQSAQIPQVSQGVQGAVPATIPGPDQVAQAFQDFQGLQNPALGITGFKAGPFNIGPLPAETARLEVAKEAAKIPAKAKAEAESLLPSVENIGSLYNEALDEALAKYPGIQEKGFEGIFSRLAAKGGKALGELPKTKAFEDGIRAYATDFAKSAGEQRPTDEDIRRFVATLPLVTGIFETPEGAAVKIRNQILKMQAKGVSTGWAVEVANRLGIDLDVGKGKGGIKGDLNLDNALEGL